MYDKEKRKEELKMKEEFVNHILYAMTGKLTEEMLEELKMILYMQLTKVDLIEKETALTIYRGEAEQTLKKFLEAKTVERKSYQTVKYYKEVVWRFLQEVQKELVDITTDDIRGYLYHYQKMRNINKVTMDNIRRILSSFFNWLCKNQYLARNPMDLIERIKPDQTIKECYSDEQITALCDNCTNKRDLALINFLNSTMVRVGELVGLNRTDINFAEREGIVFGKGSKERTVYIDGETKLHLLQYLESRKDRNPALFVTLDSPHERLSVAGVQDALKRLGKRAGIEKVHPHRFRRTGATRQLNRGMPIEQVKELLGHSKLDTTMIYLTINKNILKSTYQRLS